MYTSKVLSVVATLTLVATMTFGCRADAPRTIIVDGWWARDFAAQACRQTVAWHAEHSGEIDELGCEAVHQCPHLMPVLIACTADSARRQAKVFEWQIVRAITREAACGGVTVARSGEPGEQNIVLTELMRGPHWMLAVDYLPGFSIHSWTLISARGPTVTAEGEGAVHQIARDACAAVTEGHSAAPLGARPRCFASKSTAYSYRPWWRFTVPGVFESRALPVAAGLPEYEVQRLSKSGQRGFGLLAALV